jgi:hypothetical protein
MRTWNMAQIQSKKLDATTIAEAKRRLEDPAFSNLSASDQFYTYAVNAMDAADACSDELMAVQQLGATLREGLASSKINFQGSVAYMFGSVGEYLDPDSVWEVPTLMVCTLASDQYKREYCCISTAPAS